MAQLVSLLFIAGIIFIAWWFFSGLLSITLGQIIIYALFFCAGLACGQVAR